MKFLFICLAILFACNQQALASEPKPFQPPKNQSLIEFLKFDTLENLNLFMGMDSESQRLHKDLNWVMTSWNGKTKKHEKGVISSEFQVVNAFNIPTKKSDEHSKVSKLIPWGVERVEASRAWINGFTGEGVTVAVIDSGLDTDHVAIRNNLWVNEKEKNGIAGVDDDGNGYIDDVHGFSFVDGTPNVQDDNGHGSHVSGVIAGLDEAESFVGVAPDADIMTIKSHGKTGLSTKFAVVLSFLYAIDNNADIINCSWSGAPEASAYSQLLFDVIELAMKKKILVIAAAGNEGRYTDVDPVYPAGYELDNMISVGSVNRGSDNVSGFSNYGQMSVDIAAPGSAIKSLDHLGSYIRLSGTSMASPHVAGIAALHLQRLRKMTPRNVNALDIKHILFDTAQRVSGTENKIATGVAIFTAP
jgi:subtilisin family serine protease